MTNTKAVLLNFDPPFNISPPDGYLLSFQASTGFWIPVNVPLGINRNVHSTIVFPGPFTVLVGDDFIPVNSSGGIITINLPGVPVIGKGYTIADVGGVAATNNITVSGNGHNIVGAGTFVINVNWQTLTVVFDGTNWSKL
jgi:hypothetical protein